MMMMVTMVMNVFVHAHAFFFTVVPAEAHDGLGSTVDGQRGTDICVALAPRLEDAYIDCFRSVFRGPP